MKKLSKQQWRNIHGALEFLINKQKEKAFIEKMNKKALNYFIAHFQRIPQDQFIPGEALNNHQCYYNAVQNAIPTDCACKVKMTVHLVFCVDNVTDEKVNFLHVINKTEHGKFMDNTLGYFQKNHSYYYIKECLPDSYDCVWNWFEDMRKKFVDILGGTKGVAKYNLRTSELF